MALSLTYDQIKRELGRFLAISEDSMSWSPEDVQRVDDIILRGSRAFYFPDPIEMEGEPMVGHDWSFIIDIHQITLTGTTYHDMPSDFIRMAERPTIIGSEYPLEEIIESDWRALQNSGAGDGPPQYYHLIRTPKAEALSYKIGLYPLPKEPSTLEFRYVFDPPLPSAAQAPIVPSDHAETYLAALLATADEMLNYETAAEGKHMQRFKMLLANSILRDATIAQE